MLTMTLADALLRRKELHDLIGRMKPLMQRDLFDTHVKRVKVSDAIDEATIAVPKVAWSEFERQYNLYAKQLRLVDAAIQRANWTTDIEVDPIVTEDYIAS